MQRNITNVCQICSVLVCNPVIILAPKFTKTPPSCAHVTSSAYLTSDLQVETEGYIIFELGKKTHIGYLIITCITCTTRCHRNWSVSMTSSFKH